jgi:hypothetical protein
VEGAVDVDKRPQQQAQVKLKNIENYEAQRIEDRTNPGFSRGLVWAWEFLRPLAVSRKLTIHHCNSLPWTTDTQAPRTPNRPTK